MRISLGVTLVASLLLLCVLVIKQSDAAVCGNNVVCPVGQCCGANGQCGTTDEYCGAGCNPTFGRCKGVVQRIAAAFWGSGLEVVSIIEHPSEPFIYVFANVIGSLQVRIYNATHNVAQIDRPYTGNEGFKRGVVMEFDSQTLRFTQNRLSKAGSSAEASPTSFEFVSAVWANDTIWTSYNFGENGTVVPAGSTLSFSNTVNSFSLVAPQSTGIMRYNLETLLPAVGEAPSFFQFANLTTSAMAFDGTDLFLSGSFTNSPLQADFNPASPGLDLNETMGPRSSCVGSRDPDNFQWCAGAEDGWNFRLKIMGTSGTLGGVHFVYSQSTGPSTPARLVKALSISVDNDRNVYSCYATNSPWLTLGDSGDEDTFTSDGLNDFNHTDTSPADNLEVFCSIRGASLFTYTMDGIDGDVEEVYATVEPTSSSSSRHIYFAASTSSKTVFNITGVQESGQNLGYTLSSNPSMGSSRVTQMLGTLNGELLVSGIFSGRLEGDPSAPISHVTASTSVNSIFIFYYNKTDSPTQIQPHAVFTISNPAANFLTAKVFPTSNSTFSSPQLLFTGIYQSESGWSYGLTTLPANDGEPTFFWGVYSPEQLSHQPSPIYVPFTVAPVDGEPSPTSNASSVSITMLSLILTLSIVFLSL